MEDNKNTWVSVPLRGLLFLNNEETDFSFPEASFRPLTGPTISQSVAKVEENGSIERFRPLTGPTISQSCPPEPL